MEVVREKNQEENDSKVRGYVLTGLVTSLICIAGPLTIPIPFSPVPVSLVFLVIYLALYVLEVKKVVFSCLLYLLIGLVGVPVFSGFTGGVGKLFGPTGGYLIGYVFLAALAGAFVKRWGQSRILCILGMAAGSAVCYGFGTLWLSFQANMPVFGALAAGVLPFLPGDMIKIAGAAAIGPEIRKRLAKAGLK